MDYQELKDKAEARRDAAKSRAKESYHYARSLGFDSAESTLLQFKTKEEIDRLAKERDEVKDGENNG